MSAKYKAGLVTALIVAFGLAVLFVPSAAKLHLTMSLVSRATNDSHLICTIGMTNHGGPVSYHGYAKQNPIYWLVRETSAGSVTNSPFWCGTGIREITLAANDGVQFNAWFTVTNQPVRLFLEFKEARLLDRLLARSPAFLRARMPPREWRRAEVRL